MKTLSSVLGMAQYKPTDRSVNQFFVFDQKGIEAEEDIGYIVLSFSESAAGYLGFSASRAVSAFCQADGRFRRKPWGTMGVLPADPHR